MLKRATVLLLVVLLASYAVPVSAQTLTEEQLTAQFTAELYEYASTHSEEETRAYAQSRLNQTMTYYANLDPQQQTTLSSFISPEVLYGEGAFAGDFVTSIYLDLDYEFSLSDKLRQCIYRKSDQCLATYKTEVTAAAAVAAGIFAGCNAITAFSAFVVCIAAAYAAYMLAVQAAWDKCKSCYDNAPWECRKELGML
jgi:hypothetical protein